MGVDIEDMDITDLQAVYNVFDDFLPEAVIHCAAYTAVDAAQDNKDMCFKVNCLGSENIAKACEKHDAKILYLSTDYVFDGNGIKPWCEDDIPSPLNVYGETKLQGENAVKAFCDKHFILRISWVFGINGKNFVKTMLRLGKERDNLTVVNDQFGSPTYTYDLSVLIADMIITDKYGTYHVTNEGICTWYEFACEIFKAANLRVSVTPVTSDKYPAKAKRPTNSRMSKDKLENSGFSRLPDYKDALTRYIKELKDNGQF